MTLSSFLLTVEAATLRKYARMLELAGVKDIASLGKILDGASAMEKFAQELKEAGR